MAQRSSIPELRHRIDERFDEAQPRQQEVPAILGNGQGTDLEHVRIDNTHSWARVGNTLMEVYNKRVPHIAETGVWLGYHPDDPGLFQVLRARETYLDRGYPMTPEHGVSHGLFAEGGGHDPAYIDIRQWTPLRVYPSGGNLSVNISQMPKIWRGAWLTVDEQTLDLTAHLPAEGARYVLITIDATGVMTATAGTAVGDIFALQDSDIPTPPAGHFPLAAVRMYDTQTEIVEQRDNTDIVDLRFPPYAAMAPASGTGGVAWENVIIVALSGGDYSTIGDGMTAAVSDDIVLIAPASSYVENVTAKSGVLTAALGHVDSAEIAPAAGVPVTMPASDVLTLERLKLTPPAGSVALSVPAASTVTVVMREMLIGANGAASIGASTADATASLTLWNSTLDGDLSIKCVTVLHDCQIGGNVTQATSAGALTIYGGRIVGNLTTVAGSTISLHELPTILGTVSGAGTIIGAYLNSSGHIVFVNGTAASGFANPSGSIGMTAVNGVATTMDRSDSTHAIDAGIAPTWTGEHTFNERITLASSKSLRTVTGGNLAVFTGAANQFGNTTITSVITGATLNVSTDDSTLNISGPGGYTLKFGGNEVLKFVGAATIDVGHSVAFTKFNFVSGVDLAFNGTTRISSDGAATFASLIVNDAGADLDTRFEGDTDVNLLYLDAGNNAVVIGNTASTPGYKFHVYHNSAAARFGAESTAAVSTANVAGFDFRALTDAQSRTMVLLDANFSVTADATRTAVFKIRPVVTGTITDVLTISGLNFVVSAAALATNATDGFLYVPTCAGTPTGTPTTFTGRAPIVINTTNNKLYFYSGGAWRDAGP